MNNTKITQQAAEQIIADSAYIAGFLERSSRLRSSESGKQQLFNLLYVPDERLKQRLLQYEVWYEKVLRAGKHLSRRGKTIFEENPGELMEEIAYLTFCCLRGQDSIKAGQSYAPQHDLVVSGSSPEWFQIMDILHLEKSGRTLIIEAKNTKNRVDDHEFSRLCYILQNKFSTQAHLGIFFSRSGATGFPTNGSAHQRTLRDARATQIMFHATTKNKFVVVLSHKDIVQLKEKGSLLLILEALIRDIEETFGQVVEANHNWEETQVLPPHLLKYADQT